MAATDEEARFVLIRSGQRIVALPLDAVRETMRPLPVEAMQGSPAYLKGISLIRGVPTPVVDTWLLLFAPSAERETASSARFVTLTVGERAAALAVDAVIGVRSLSREQLHAVPPLFREAGAERMLALGALDQQLLMVLEPARVIPQSIWAVLERRRDSP